MLVLHGFTTQNTLKALYTLEELGTPYRFRFVDLFKGEHRTPEFRQLTPVGKVPVLQDGDFTLFESGAICRYLGDTAQSPLYPSDSQARATIEQWMDFMSCHLGRWFNTLYFEQSIRAAAGLGEPNPAEVEQATKFVRKELSILNAALTDRDFLLGEQISIADLFSFAYVEQARPLNFSLAEWPQVDAWVARIDQREAIARAREQTRR